MPKTKFQGIIFGLLMSMTMAYGMEVYNVAIKLGYASMPGGFSNMDNSVFLLALQEAAYMWILVFLFSNLWGNRLGHRIAAKIVRPEQDNPFITTVLTSASIVLIMCPTMSAAAAVLFSIVLGGRPVSEFPAIWAGTLLKNFPMALLWNLFAAGPLSRWIFGRIFRKQQILNIEEKAA